MRLRWGHGNCGKAWLHLNFLDCLFVGIGYTCNCQVEVCFSRMPMSFVVLEGYLLLIFSLFRERSDESCEQFGSNKAIKIYSNYSI